MVRTAPGEQEGALDNYAVYSFDLDRRGSVKKVTAYVDLETGEIIPAGNVRIPKVDVAKRIKEKEAALKSMRPEVRKFALFVLRFRNRRRGLTPDLDTIGRWYSELCGKQVSHVRRYYPALRRAGILAGSNVLSPAWQMHTTRSKEHVAEDGHATIEYMLACVEQGDRAPAWFRRMFRSVSVGSDYNPTWTHNAEPTPLVLSYQAYAEVITKIAGTPPTVDPHEFAVRQGAVFSRRSYQERDWEYLNWRDLWRFRAWWAGRFYGPLRPGKHDGYFTEA